MRLSALCAGRPLPPGRFLVLISVRGWVDPRATVRLEGLGQYNWCSSGISVLALSMSYPRHNWNELLPRGNEKKREELSPGIFMWRWRNFAKEGTTGSDMLWFIYLLVYCLFNDADSTSRYIRSNGRTTVEWWIGKDTEGSDRCLISGSISTFRSRDSSVGIAIGYGLDDRGFGVRVPVGSRISFSPRRRDRVWGPLSLLSNGYRGLLPRG
jgi:hypothetical protein